MSAATETRPATPPNSRWSLFACAALLAAILAGGAWFYHAKRQAIRDSVANDLIGIARLKAADTPQAALVVAAEHPDAVDLLLTDVVMPGMNGRDLAQKLARDFRSMKVLYMSGYTANVIAHRGILDAGMQFMNKPVGRDELARKVREVLG